MNTHPQVSAYFIQSDPKITQAYLDGDTVWCPGEEAVGQAIFNKTLAALELFQGYQYLFRSNLSSFVNLKELVKYLDYQPSKGFYAGYLGWHGQQIFASGCGFSLSWDLVQALIERKHQWKQICQQYLDWDDVLIANALAHLGIAPVFAPRCDFETLSDWELKYPQLQDHFHFRVKTTDGDRVVIDQQIHDRLYRTFY